MFNLKKFKLVNKLKNVDIKSDWLKFTNVRKTSKSREEFISEIASDNKFVEEDLKLRNMVEEMLVEELFSDIKKNKSYNFLVDSVVNKLKQKQLGNNDLEEEII